MPPYARYACTQEQYMHPIAVLQPAPLQCVHKLQHINGTTIVVAQIPDFAEYINDGGQGWTAAIVSFDIMIFAVFRRENSTRLWVAAIFALSHTVQACIPIRDRMNNQIVEYLFGRVFEV